MKRRWTGEETRRLIRAWRIRSTRSTSRIGVSHLAEQRSLRLNDFLGRRVVAGGGHVAVKELDRQQLRIGHQDEGQARDESCRPRHARRSARERTSMRMPGRTSETGSVG